MKASDIDITDYMRILFGEMPFEFIPELIIRVVIVYLILVVTMRLMGPRMEAQLSRNEIVALVTLAATVGILPHNPDRGILPALIVAAVVLAFQFVSAKLIKRSEKAERLLIDLPATLISEGRFRINTMKRTRIQRERLVSELRGQE